MRLYDLFSDTVKTLDSLSKGKPIKKGSIDYKAFIKAYKVLLDWLYPELSTDNIQLVVTCNKCKNYKRYRKKGDALKPTYIWRCSLDKQRRSPDFFCKDGKERDS